MSAAMIHISVRAWCQLAGATEEALTRIPVPYAALACTGEIVRGNNASKLMPFVAQRDVINRPLRIPTCPTCAVMADYARELGGQP